MKTLSTTLLALMLFALPALAGDSTLKEATNPASSPVTTQTPVVTPAVQATPSKETAPKETAPKVSLPVVHTMSSPVAAKPTTPTVATAVKGSPVNGVSMSYQPGKTVVAIQVNGPVTFAHQTEVPKDGKPNRIIVDLQGAVHQMAQKNFNLLPASVVTSIRTSQYSTTPNPTVRVVLDLSSAAIYEINKKGNAVELSIVDATVKPFPAWSSTAVVPANTLPTATPKSTGSPALGVVTPKVTPPVTASTSHPSPATSATNTTVAKPSTPTTTASAPANVKPITLSSTTTAPSTAKPISSEVAVNTTPFKPAVVPSTTPGTPTVATTTPKPVVPAVSAENKSELKPSATAAPSSVEVVPTWTSPTATKPASTHASSAPTTTSSAHTTTPSTSVSPNADTKSTPSAATSPALANKPVTTPTVHTTVPSTPVTPSGDSKSTPSVSTSPVLANKSESTSAQKSAPVVSSPSHASTASSASTTSVSKPIVSATTSSTLKVPTTPVVNVPVVKSTPEVTASTQNSPVTTSPIKSATSLPSNASPTPSVTSPAVKPLAETASSQSASNQPKTAPSPVVAAGTPSSTIKSTVPAGSPSVAANPEGTKPESSAAIWHAPMTAPSTQSASKNTFPSTTAGSASKKLALASDKRGADVNKADTSLDDENWAHEPAVSLNEEDDKAAPVKPTARFRRDATSAKIKGTMIAQFPQRLVIKYEASGQRDPFATLIDNKYAYTSPTEQRIPNVEGLKMVGVLESESGAKNSALFEDNDGYSYILKSGDKVRNGYVLRVEEDKVFFQIFEYGWSRTLALKMQEI